MHRNLMYQILRDIFSSDIWKYLAFKGGTACYFFHNLDRFSTDLDFDILDSSQKIDIQLEWILTKYGVLKKSSRNMILSYGQEDVNIKIDFSRQVWDNNSYEIRNFYGIDIKTQDKGTIFANKLVALTQRNTNRDIYDVYFFFQNDFPINDALIFERTWKDLTSFFSEVLQKLTVLWKNYNILDGLWDVLDEKQKYFVKHQLVPELIGVIQYRIDFMKR